LAISATTIWRCGRRPDPVRGSPGRAAQRLFASP